MTLSELAPVNVMVTLDNPEPLSNVTLPEMLCLTGMTAPSSSSSPHPFKMRKTEVSAQKTASE
jgi:hypothetical protein